MPKTEKRGVETTSQEKSNRKRKVSQEAKVLNHMREYGSITSMEAFYKYSITRLSAKIFNLRGLGFQITTHWETSEDGTRYGRYTLKEDVA